MPGMWYNLTTEVYAMWPIFRLTSSHISLISLLDQIELIFFNTADTTCLPWLEKTAVSWNIVGIGRDRTRSVGVVIPLFHHPFHYSIPPFHSTIPFHRSIPPNKDTHTMPLLASFSLTVEQEMLISSWTGRYLERFLLLQAVKLRVDIEIERHCTLAGNWRGRGHEKFARALRVIFR